MSEPDGMEPQRRGSRGRRLATALGVIAVGLVVLAPALVWEIWSGQSSASRALLVFALTVASGYFALRFLRLLADGDIPAVESHWGGFGGGLGGWTISASLGHLLGAVFFAGVLVMATLPPSEDESGKGDAEEIVDDGDE